MTTPFWCLLVTMAIPIVLAMSGGFFRMQQFGKLDNKHPRLQSAQLEGIGARNLAAQQNAWEALALFAPSVLVAHMAGADPASSATAALVFVGARVLHAVFYLANLDMLRSLIFFVAVGSCVSLFVMAARA